MSAGPRITLEQATRVLAFLGECWELSSSHHVVGSVRRRKPEVGDLEILAPHEDKARDTLYQRIARTVRTDDAGGLFAGAADIKHEIGRAVRGLKPGFLAASLVINVKPDGGVEVPVQIFRYTPDNLGWMLLYRTGPEDFGKWFLGEWKKRHGIPLSREDRPASKDNHLIDGEGRVVKVPDEEAAFVKAGIRFVPPEERDRFIAGINARRVGV